MESREQPGESKHDIEDAVEDLLDQIGDETPTSELKIKIKKVGGKVVRGAVEHKGATLFAAGVLTAAGFMEYRHRRRSRKK